MNPRAPGKGGRPTIFTEKQDDLLRKHYPAGCNMKWLAAVAKKTVEQVRSRAGFLKLTRPELTICNPQTIEAQRAMWETGVRTAIIMETLDLTRHQVYLIAKQNGMVRPRDFRRAECVRARQAGIEKARRLKWADLACRRLPERDIASIYAGQRYEDVRLRA